MTADDARRLALALAGAVEHPHHALTSFRVRGKIFATMTPDGAELRVFVSDDEVRDHWIAVHPQAVAPLYWGRKRCGLAVRLAKARPEWVETLLELSWRERC